MSDNLSQNEIFKIYNYNKTSQTECTPINKKRKANESPETDERILRFTAAAKRKRQRLDKKIKDKIIQHATSPIVSILLNGVLTDIDIIKVPELRQLLINKNLNSKGNKQELKDKLKEVKYFFTNIVN